MHLIEPLSVGIAAAANGTVDLLRRGSSTRVTYYTSFEGDGATTPTSSIDLDASGGGVFYVNEATDVVVRDSTGTEVRRFVSASAASSVEVISQSFTGTDYDSGATAANKPTTLSAVLDLVSESFGTTNFNVVVNGVTKTITNAISGLATLFFSVTDPTYGAEGDGVTNDLVALQAAADAADAAGGGIVYFPEGTYVISGGTLTIPAGVSLLGVGPGGSRIAVSGTGKIAFAASPTYWQTISGLRIDPLSISTQHQLDIITGNRVVISNCNIGSSSTSGSALRVRTDGTDVWCYNCVFSCSDVGVAIQANTNVSRVTCVGCIFVLPSSGGGLVMVDIRGGGLLGCTFDTSAFASGTMILLQVLPNAGGSNGDASFIVGCKVPDPAGGTVTFRIASTDATMQGLLDVNNVLGTNIVNAGSSSQATAATYFDELNLRREGGRYYLASNAAAVSVSPDQYGEIEIVRTDAGNQTVTFDTSGAPNRCAVLVYHQNFGAGSGTITMSANVKGLTTFTVNATSVSYYFFVSVHRGTSKYWVLIGSAVNQTP